MKCEDLQFNLAVYADDILTDEERGVLDAHLPECPVCRQKLADLQELRIGLRGLPRPEFSPVMMSSLRTAVAEKLDAANPVPHFYLASPTAGGNWRRFLLPYGIGAFASFIFGALLLQSLMTAVPSAVENAGGDQNVRRAAAPVLLANSTAAPDNEFTLTPTQYAETRLSVAGESPSINPQGALLALTKSLVRGDMKDEEVVVVADVFSNGLAKIEEVVEPSKNRRAVYELEQALKKDSSFAPFVPADLDRRSDSVRVILKIGTVNVKTNLNARRK